MAYLRDYSLTVTGGGTIAPEIDVHFLVRQATIQSPWTAEIRVYNLADSTARAIPLMDQSTSAVKLDAGYKDEGVSTIFQGELHQRRIGRQDPVTTFVDLFARMGDNAANFAAVSKTVSAGSKPMDHYNAVVDAMSKYGISAGYVSSGILDGPQFPRAVSWYGMARDVMRTLAKSVNADWWIDNDAKLNLVSRTDSLPGGAVTLNAQTGLIGQPTATPGGIEVRSLLTGKIGVGSLIKIDSSSIQQAALDQSYGGDSSQATNALQHLGVDDGTYKVIYMERRGHLRGQEWYNDYTCIGATTGVVPQALTGVVGNTGIGSNTPTFSGAQ